MPGRHGWKPSFNGREENSRKAPRPHTSYSHRGRYYTLDRIAKFDELGLWSYRDVWFSIHWTLLSTVAALVETADSGRSDERSEVDPPDHSQDQRRTPVPWYPGQRPNGCRAAQEEAGFSLRVNHKKLSGSAHPDRDAQFSRIAELRERFATEHLPIISVDTKKKELIGSFKKPRCQVGPRARACQ